MSNSHVGAASLKYPFDCLTDLVFVPDEEIVPSDIILVPGGSHIRPMELAAELFKTGMANYILPSGGYNAKIGKTEWEFLKDIGISSGVPEDRILKEDQAKNTFDNARNSWKVIVEQQIEVRRAIIVSKSFFSRRALMTYQTVFPETVIFQVKQDDSRLNRENWYYNELGIKTVLTEAEKITKYFGHHIPNWVKQREEKGSS
ncbi:YdcF family protein [Paenibacillus sp. MBLB4367]|uniref:YdcF family protein n=1 Tax=Paenibacillus sp. MBLB4367 TaxID=3384767 RepID=UPI003907FF06